VLATTDSRTKNPAIVRPGWPLIVQDANRQPIRGGQFLLSYLHEEEKGSDVNAQPTCFWMSSPNRSTPWS
jgi:hypothetical protein